MYTEREREIYGMPYVKSVSVLFDLGAYRSARTRRAQAEPGLPQLCFSRKYYHYYYY